MTPQEPTPQTPPRGELLLAGWRVQPGLNRLISPGGDLHQVEPKTIAVLVALAAARGEVVTREQLIEQAWGGGFVTDDVVTRAVGQLRRIFEGHPGQPQMIETIRKRGYRMLVLPEAVTSRPATPLAVAPSADREAPGRRAWVLPIALAALALIAAGGFWGRSSRRVIAPPALVTVPVGIDGVEVRRPRISPDGTRIAYSRQEGPHTLALWTVLLGGGAPLRLTGTDGALDVPGAWSPDGSELAYTHRVGGEDGAGGTCEIRVVAALGGADRRVAPCGDREALSLAWSPDGATLIYASSTDGASPAKGRAVTASGAHSPRSLCALTLASGETRALTTPPDGWLGDDGPAFSPDGRTLAFVRSIAPDVDDIWVMPAAGGAPRRLTDDHAMIIGADFLADGTTVVFSSSRAGLNSLWAIDVRGGEPVFVAGAGPKIKHPSAARTVDRLVFESWEFEIQLERVERSGARTALAVGPEWSYQPQYSPDGGRLAFVSTRSGSPQIWLSARDGSGVLQLTNAPLGQVATPRWSPSGREIVFVGRPEGEADLYLVPTDGSGVLRRLTETPGDEVAPSFSRDGGALYFAARVAGAWQVQRIPRLGGAAVAVTADGGFAARESLDGKDLYFTRAEQPGLFRMSLSPKGTAVETVLPNLRPADAQAWELGPLGPYVEAYEPDADGDRVREYIRMVKEPPVLADLLDAGWNGFTVSPDGKDLVYARIARHVCRVVRLDRPRT